MDLLYCLRKVFVKLNFQLTEDLIRELCLGKAGLIERFLMHLRAKIEKAMWDMQKDTGERKDIAEKVNKSSQRMHTNSKGLKPNFNDKPEADQDLSKCLCCHWLCSCVMFFGMRHFHWL